MNGMISNGLPARMRAYEDQRFSTVQSWGGAAQLSTGRTDTDVLAWDVTVLTRLLLTCTDNVQLASRFSRIYSCQI